MWGLVLAGAVAYTLPAVGFWAIQDRMVFPAPSVPQARLDAAAEIMGAKVVEVTTEDGVRLRGWHRQAVRGGERSVVLYFHGNAETVDGRWDLHDLALRYGQDLVVFAYRGYPGSEGAPSEAGLRKDARAAWKFVTEDLGVPPERVLLHGKSLGGGVAAGLATDVRPRGLVLESTFTSVRALARRTLPIYPVSLLLRHPFDTDRLAGRITCPTLVLHGAADSMIPVSHGRALAAAIPGARYVEVAGADHGETLPALDPTARAAWTALLP